MVRNARWAGALAALALLVQATAARAQRAPFENPLLPDGGKLPLTAGFTEIDGAGGGGLVPWAVITGYGTADSWGANVHYTALPLRDFTLQSYGAAVGVLDRIEASFAADRFEATSAPLDGLRVEQRIVGLKVRLAGDLVYGQDSWLPQTALGFEYKRNTGIANATGLEDVDSLGAQYRAGTDWYLSATKLLLAQSVLLDLTLRATKANELGLLGFGGPLRRARSVEPEATVGYLVTRTLAVGAEYRGRPHNLATDREQPAWDVFAAWAASRHVSLVAAFVRLGSILAPVTQQPRAQAGAYVSLQVGL